MFFGTIERCEERFDSLLIGVLRGGKAGFVDAVVDIVVGPVVCTLDFLLEVLGEKHNLLVLIGDDIVEFRVEHADYFTRLDAHKLWV